MANNVSNIQAILEKVLGDSIAHRRGEISLHCPFCNHYKKKLGVNLRTHKWQCWVCSKKGGSLTYLLAQAGAPKEDVAVMSSLVGDKPLHKQHHTRAIDSLPADYKSLHIQLDTPAYKQALHYAVAERGLSGLDILRYQVGFCDSGPFGGMLIIPSYDCNGMLNFYTGRSYYKQDIKFKNPPISRDIIGFESQINWKEPIILVEGAFDAITAKRNAIPLFSKKILGNLRSKIVRERVKEIYLCLDSDALKDSVAEVEYFMNNGIAVHLVQLPGKDPNEVGFNAVLDARHKSMPLNLMDLVKLRMSL